ncbi:uncharacterized protein LOC125039392 [Penaeus chinensis]|uniref:uncharacterized protein LOC125039392 n=1 Tax=Penaeus chinensis TaxID=139456 RepID=UPI001FB6F15A|nr:uncharacterized protein LOC125039392 [Penaeus chinensis]
MGYPCSVAAKYQGNLHSFLLCDRWRVGGHPELFVPASLSLLGAWTCWVAATLWHHACPSAALGAPLLGPDVMSFDSLPPLTLWHSPVLPAVPLQAGLPAPKGTVFDGPDPGLNAAIITVPTESCPSGYRRDFNGVCRLKFGYGPNPFYSFTPENFKGDVQFYMGLQVGGPQPGRRRGRGRGRPRPAAIPPPIIAVDDDDD